jgi:uncharacterized protein YdeI (YjbR/CyaY-like superfamily)
MIAKNKEIDAYIKASEAFAKPILKHLRQLVHTACPGVEETIKWKMPHFEYKGNLCYMASFKSHCGFGFWKASLMKESTWLKGNQQDGMGNFGRITSLKDLPGENVIMKMIEEAMMLNEMGIRLPAAKKKVENEEIILPEMLSVQLNKNKKAATTFHSFSASRQKEYIKWITEAKTEATQNKRLTQAVEWLAEGKSLHWKYEKK